MNLIISKDIYLTQTFIALVQHVDIEIVSVQCAFLEN